MQEKSCSILKNKKESRHVEDEKINLLWECMGNAIDVGAQQNDFLFCFDVSFLYIRWEIETLADWDIWYYIFLQFYSWNQNFISDALCSHKIRKFFAIVWKYFIYSIFLTFIIPTTHNA